MPDPCTMTVTLHKAEIKIENSKFVRTIEEWFEIDLKEGKQLK